jgi:Family of unknown function (DUF6311)
LEIFLNLPRQNSYLFPSLIGAVAFFIIAGPQFLDPSNVAWLVGGDPLQHYLGWAFFRNGPWTVPLGLNPLYGMDFSNAIVFTDSIPLFAIPFKVISSFLPEPFQYLGIWVLLCFMLQALFAYRLIGLFCDHTALKALGTIFFVFSPPLIFRLSLHESLMGHCLILAALYLSLRTTSFQTRPTTQYWHASAWILLLSVAVLVHFYLAVMVLVLWLADLASRTFIQKIITYKQLAAESICMILVVIFVAWQAGYFAIEGASGATRGFGDFRTNLLALFNSRGWSYFLRPIPLRDAVEAATGEGFQYLGMGSLLLLATAVYAVVIRRFHTVQMIKLAWKKYGFLIAALTSLALLSFSNRIGFGPWNFTIHLPESFLNLFSIVRASSRLFWPMYYIIILAIVFIVIRSFKLKSALYIFSAAACLQIIDTSAGWLPIREKVAVTSSTTFKTVLQNSFWQSAGKHYKKIVSNSGQENWESLGIYASSNQMATNITHLARVDNKKMVDLFKSINQQVHVGPLDLETLYILQDWKTNPDRITFDPKTDLLARINGVNVLAPGWKTCSSCPQAPSGLELAQLAPALEMNQLVQFTQTGNGRAQFMLGGWGFTEDWGTWATDSLAKVILPMPKGDPEKLIISANAFLSPQHSEQVVDIAINGIRVADHMVLSKAKGNALEVKLPRGPKAVGEPVIVEFRSLNAISPRDAGLGADERKLGIGLVSIEFAR